MAAATSTTLGEVVLSGDLAGSVDGNFPQLRASGVTPGTYSLIQRISFDSKGRAVSVGVIDFNTDVVPLIGLATTTSKGVYSLGQGLAQTAGAVSALDATSAVKGIFSAGSGLSATSGVISANFASFQATSSVNGFVQLGGNINNTSGTISIEDATSSTKGVFSVGTNLTAAGGVVSVNYSSLVATTSVFGMVRVGTGFGLTSGVISVPISTSGALGVAQVGAGFAQVGSVISLPDATSSVKGVYSISSSVGLTVASGAVTLSTVVAQQNKANLFAKAQNGAVSVVTGSTLTPNFQTGAATLDITLTSNLAINFPTVLAPTGTLVTQNVIIRYDAGTAYTVSLNGTYKTNKALGFTNAASAAIDVLTLLCTDSVCYAMLNETFL